MNAKYTIAIRALHQGDGAYSGMLAIYLRTRSEETGVDILVHEDQLGDHETCLNPADAIRLASRRADTWIDAQRRRF